MDHKKFFWRLTAILSLLLLLCSAINTYASPAGYSDYFIPGDETHLGILWYNIGATGGVPSATSPRHRVISVVAWSPDTKLYYDHWQDGYNFDPNNPDATADEVVVLTNKGDSKIFESANIALPQTPVAAGTCKTLGACAYSGKDRIYVAGGVVSVTTESWVQSVGNVFTIAWDVYPVKPQMTTYVLPFGEDLAAAPRSYRSFDRVFALIEATEDNTVVQMDFNQDGTWDNFCTDKTRATCTSGTSVTLNKGEVFLLDDYAVSPQAAPYNVVHTGTLVKASETLQMNYVIGNHNDNYQGRGFSAFPRGYWDTEYYSPADSTNGTTTYPTNIYIYNPNTATLTINYQTTTGSGSFTVPAGETRSMREQAGIYVPQGSGVYLKADSPFWGVTDMDDGGQTHEWGYGLIPAFLLGNEQYVGWAPAGTSTLPAPAGNRDDGGIYITPAQDNTRVFVDTNQDGTAEYTYTVNRNQTQFVYNTVTGDMSNSHIWATGPISLAYGQNPATSPTGAPAVDLGYSILPGGDWIDKVLTVSKAADPVVVPTVSGSTSTYTLTVNSYYYAVNGISVVDTLPTGWQYVSGTTTITLADKTTSSANPSVSGQMLTWSSALLGGMAANQTITIAFTAQTTQPFNVGDLTMNQVQATGTRTVGGLTQTFTTTDFAFNTFADNAVSMQVAKSSSVPAATPVNPGNTITYTVTLTNPASATANQTGVAIYDPLPNGVSYVASSGSVTCERLWNVRDEFGTIAYTNNGPNNTANWSTNWTETDSGPGTAGATGGFLWITAGQLQFRYLLANVNDSFNTNASYAGNNGSNNWNANWTETNDNGSAATGSIVVTGNHARYRQGTASRSISRTATVTGATSATISFIPTDNGIDAGETLVAEYSVDGGAFINIGPAGGYDGNTAGWSGNTQTVVVALAGNNTITVRFRAPQAWNSAVNDEAWVDNVDISFNATANATGTQIQRTANLTGATSATLNFNYSSSGLAAGDTLVVEAASSAAGPFTIMGTYTGGSGFNVAPPYNLTSYISANTTIRFRVTGGYNSTAKTFNLDNVDISYTLPGTFASGNPPQFLSGGALCVIRPNNSLSLTYNVTVDNPLATGIDQITNTATANSNEIILPVNASVSNLVVNPSSASASVGDRVWLDANGNGVLDVGEPGLANVEITLKDQFGTPLMTTTTDATGHYLLTGIEPGNGYYVEASSGTLPSGLVQSAPAGHSDNRTNAFNLTAGQSYMTADLGYKSGPLSAVIGNLVWVDFNSNGLHDAGEPGLAGVTVKLGQDANGNGVIDVGETVTTTTTAANGGYLFTGVTANGVLDYIVYINEPPLTGYTRTTPTGSSSFSILNITAGAANLSANFGYYSATTYSIKDRVWFDADGNGSQSGVLETGIALVTIDLLDASLNAIATTTTDASGDFTFTGVIGSGADYNIRITDTNGKLTDYYGTTASAQTGIKQIINLSGNIDYTAAPDFGYSLKRSIGSKVFNDINNNSIQDTGELGFSGITVKLYSDAGVLGVIDGSDAVVATITTDANGNYLFSGLSDGNYIVSIETPPSGYTYLGTDSDAVKTGQQQPAGISGGSTALDKNFRYQTATPHSASGTIWSDTDADGVIDGTEARLSGVTVDLLQGSTVVATTSTAADGSYNFSGLVSDLYTVKVTDNTSVLNGYVATYEKTGGTAGPFDGQESVDLSSGNQTGVNFGYKIPIPTLVILSDFRTYNENSRVRVEWTTSSEIDTVGFFLFRLDESTGKYRQINQNLLPALLISQQGGTYSLIDNGASLEKGNTYVLVEIEGKGARNSYGPFTVRAGGSNAVESQYNSTAKAAGAFLSSLDRSAELQSKNITRYVDSEGTIVMTNSSNPARGAGNSVADETSNYVRKAKAVSAEKKARVIARKEAKERARFLKKQRRGNMVKISVSEDGLYYISSSELSGFYGISQDDVIQLIKTARLALSNQGKKVAYLPSEDYSGIYFYGQGTDTIYTKENIYWIYRGRGLQMRTKAGRGPETVEYDTFKETVHAEEDKIVVPVLAKDPESDYWFWDYVVGGDPALGTKAFTVETYGTADVSSAATMTITLHGLTDTGVAHDHHVTFSLNGTVIGEDLWKGTEERVITLSFGQGLLYTGANTIEVKGLLDTGAPYSVFYVDSFDLTYQRLYEARENSLTFTAVDTQPLTVYGFTEPDISVFDITDPNRPVLTMATTPGGATDNYSISFTPSPGSRYLAVTAGAAATELNAWANTGSRLFVKRNRADWLIIAPDTLLTAARSLATYRQSQGLEVMVVDLEDIMDEFNYGISSPEAVRDFLKYAHDNWKKPPRYVVLAGDGTYDYKDNMGAGDNLVPTLMTETPQMLSPSDNLFGDTDGDHVPEISIGRLPVLTAEELQAVTGKIIAYENAPGSDIIMLADNQDDGGNFPTDSNDIAALVPSDYSVKKIYLSDYALDAARQILFESINSGAALLNYIGHAGVDRLANEGLLRSSDVVSLQNSGRPFVLAAMTCTVGNFALPGYDSLSEALVTKSDGGAVAVWAPTGLSFNLMAKVFDENFVRETFGNGRAVLGDVILKTFENYNATGNPAYIMDIYNLQGDPALKLW